MNRVMSLCFLAPSSHRPSQFSDLLCDLVLKVQDSPLPCRFPDSLFYISFPLQQLTATKSHLVCSAVGEAMPDYHRRQKKPPYTATVINTDLATAAWSSGSSSSPMTIWWFRENKLPMIDNMTIANADTTVHIQALNAPIMGFIFTTLL